MEESKNLTTFGEELKTALTNLEDIKKKGSNSTDPASKYVVAPFCPFYRICPSFSERNYLCTYQFADRKYCDEYSRLKRNLRT